MSGDWLRLPDDSNEARAILRDLLEHAIADAIAETRASLQAQGELSDAAIEFGLRAFEQKVWAVHGAQLEEILKRRIH